MEGVNVVLVPSSGFLWGKNAAIISLHCGGGILVAVSLSFPYIFAASPAASCFVSWLICLAPSVDGRSVVLPPRQPLYLSSSFLSRPQLTDLHHRGCFIASHRIASFMTIHTDHTGKRFVRNNPRSVHFNFINFCLSNPAPSLLLLPPSLLPSMLHLISIAARSRVRTTAYSLQHCSFFSSLAAPSFVHRRRQRTAASQSSQSHDGAGRVDEAGQGLLHVHLVLFLFFELMDRACMHTSSASVVGHSRSSLVSRAHHIPSNPPPKKSKKG